MGRRLGLSGEKTGWSAGLAGKRVELVRVTSSYASGDQLRARRGGGSALRTVPRTRIGRSAACMSMSRFDVVA